MTWASSSPTAPLARPCQIAWDRWSRRASVRAPSIAAAIWQAAVARRMHERRRDRAVEAHDAAVLDLLLPGARQQRSIDRLPGLGSDRANRLVQHRFLRAPRPRQAGKGPERGGVLEMEGQFLVAQLAVLLEKRTAQHR